MPSGIKRGLSRRFSSIRTDVSKSSSASETNTSFTSLTRQTFSSVTSASTVTPSTPTTSLTNNLTKAGFITGDHANQRRHSIAKASKSAPIPLDTSVYADGLSQGAKSARRNGPHSRQISSPLPGSHPAFGSEPLTPSKAAISRNGVTVVDCSVPVTSALPDSTVLSRSGKIKPQTASSTMPRIGKGIPLEINTSLPAYVLDRLHPHIPFPTPWDHEHDQYIVSLDVQDYHLPAIVKRLKQRFPELRGECITPGMIDKRLRILDLRVDWQGWKRAISNMPPVGHIDDFDSGFDSYAASGASTPKANNAKKILSNVANKAKTHHRRVSTGGMSGKITINKRGTSVTNLSVGGPSIISPSNISPLASHNRTTTNFSLPLNADSSPASPPTASATGAQPSTPPLTHLTVPERAAVQLTQIRDFCVPDPAVSGTESIKMMERKEYLGSLRTTTRAKGKARAEVPPLLKQVGFGKVEDERDQIGVPSVMRTSSGRPVLR